MTENASDDIDENVEQNHQALKLQEEIEELKDKLLRNAAESENMRKRYEKQIEDSQSYAIVNFAKDLVNVIDNLERVIEHKPSELTDELKNVITGVELTCAELKQVFKKNHITSIDAQKGDKFDYNLHHAIATIATNEQPDGSVIQVMQVGYKIKDRLLRPVVVSIAQNIKDAT